MFYVNVKPEGKFVYTETIKLYCKHVTVRSQLRQGARPGRGLGGGGGERRGKGASPAKAHVDQNI